MDRRAFLASAATPALFAGNPLDVPLRHREGVPLKPPFTRLVEDSDLEALAPQVTILKGVWPGIPSANLGAGPTGVPWIDSNAWRIQEARARSSKPVWISFTAPKRVLAARDYLIAIADCAAAGALWIADLPADMIDATARAVDFFVRHQVCRRFPAAGAIGVLGANDDSHECMNLLVRGHLPFRVITPDSHLDGLACILAFDEPALTARRAHLKNWLDAGGALITNLRDFPPGPRVILWKDEAVDPYLVAQEAKRLLGRQRDPLRVYNMFTSNLRWTESPDRQSSLVEFVNYTGRPLPDETTLWLRRTYRRAWLHTWHAAPRELTPLRTDGGTEIVIPEREIYAALELAA